MFSEVNRPDEPGHGADRAQQPHLPPAREEQVLVEPLHRLHFSFDTSQESPRLTSLVVKTVHPQFPAGQCPEFCLTPLLELAYQVSPATTEQVVDPETREESRREAIRILAASAGSASPILRELQKPLERAPHATLDDHLNDELEPRFRIEAQCSTSFNDFLDGVCRKEIAVLRNDQAVVRFDVVQDDSRLVNAEIDAVPIEIRWPILDQEGEPVTLSSVDSAILDFSSLLFSKRAASWGVALQAVAEELERRQWERLIVHDLLPREHFLFSLLAAAPEGQLRSSAPPADAVSLALAPQGRDLEPKDLGDGRVVWLGFERAGPGVAQPRISFAGYLSCGTEYRVDVSVPGMAQFKARSIHRELLGAGSTSRFFALIDRLVSIPGARAVCCSGSEVGHCPESINGVVSSAEETDPLLRFERGGWTERFSLFEPHARDRVRGLVRGFSPLKADRVGASPGRSWRIECLLDEELSGGVFARNCLGDTLRVALERGVATKQAREDFLLRFFAHASSPAPELKRIAETAPGCNVQFEAPASLASLTVADAVATHWQQEAQRVGRLKDFSAAFEIPWWVDSLPRGRCALSILPIQQPGFRWVAHHALVIGPRGIEEVYLSVGERNVLGGLTGLCARPGEERDTFSAAEQSAIVRVLADEEAGLSQARAEALLEAALPNAVLKRRVVMRQQDPGRDSRDFFQMAINWVREILGLNQD